VFTTTVCLLVTFFAQGIVIVYPPIFLFWVLIHTRIDYWRTMGKRAYWYAGLAWPAISGPLFFWRKTIFSVRLPTAWWVVAAGILALAAACLVYRQAARVISRRTLLGLVELEPQLNPQPVMQTGIYSKTRNPIYLAHWLLIFGAAAISGYAAAWILFGLDAILLWVLIRTEERELVARYGADFQAYMGRVPRFFPRWPW
jgi:protein-S-isoprenylcysteine O-methyltransferase Ste14